MSSVEAQQGSAGSIAGDVRPAEPHDMWEARVAEYSHDNVFAGIYSRGEDQGSSSGGNGQAGADLDDLEAIMAASQPLAGQGDAAQAESPSTTVGSKSD
ncbi:hypothetical protein CEP54_006520 [Fusarium duplospermum]|uniref:Uncharacterized protein n=1 Tax=Fusarium duplospermum TaxID=1325734 RepID=A0A428Q6E8_9HYPO|nr:hypothetical protein CEP54_006520 [Fusarium duplospermum]